MRKFNGWFLTLLLAGFLAGCGGGSSTAKDSDTTTFSIPLSALQIAQQTTAAPASSSSTPFTSVIVRLSRENHTDIVQNLTVLGDVATGEVTGLTPGYWHVSAPVYRGADQAYQGQADVQVLPGVAVTCSITPPMSARHRL